MGFLSEIVKDSFPRRNAAGVIDDTLPSGSSETEFHSGQTSQQQKHTGADYHATQTPAGDVDAFPDSTANHSQDSEETQNAETEFDATPAPEPSTSAALSSEPVPPGSSDSHLYEQTETHVHDTLIPSTPAAGSATPAAVGPESVSPPLSDSQSFEQTKTHAFESRDGVVAPPVLQTPQHDSVQHDEGNLPAGDEPVLGSELFRREETHPLYDGEGNTEDLSAATALGDEMSHAGENEPPPAKAAFERPGDNPRSLEKDQGTAPSIPATETPAVTHAQIVEPGETANTETATPQSNPETTAEYVPGVVSATDTTSMSPEMVHASERQSSHQGRTESFASIPQADSKLAARTGQNDDEVVTARSVTKDASDGSDVEHQEKTTIERAMEIMDGAEEGSPAYVPRKTNRSAHLSSKGGDRESTLSVPTGRWDGEVSSSNDNAKPAPNEAPLANELPVSLDHTRRPGSQAAKPGVIQREMAPLPGPVPRHETATPPQGESAVLPSRKRQGETGAGRAAGFDKGHSKSPSPGQGPVVSKRQASAEEHPMPTAFAQEPLSETNKAHTGNTSETSQGRMQKQPQPPLQGTAVNGSAEEPRDAGKTVSGKVMVEAGAGRGMALQAPQPAGGKRTRPAEQQHNGVHIGRVDITVVTTAPEQKRSSEPPAAVDISLASRFFLRGF